jgi:AcrR family transcriptional regulator
MVRFEHSTETIVDAARRVVVNRGIRATTLEAITEESKAPIGSIYYRFSSLDELLARLWLRAVRRAQAVALKAGPEDPLESVVARALALYDLCLEEREDALLLASFRHADFEQAQLAQELRNELDAVNAPIERPLRDSVRAIFGRADRSGFDLVLLALVSMPYCFARQHLEARTVPPASHRARLEAAVRAALARPEGRPSHRQEEKSNEDST